MKHDKGTFNMQAYSVYYTISTNVVLGSDWFVVLGSDCTKDHSKHTAHPILHKSKHTFFFTHQDHSIDTCNWLHFEMIYRVWCVLIKSFELATETSCNLKNYHIANKKNPKNHPTPPPKKKL